MSYAKTLRYSWTVLAMLAACSHSTLSIAHSPLRGVDGVACAPPIPSLLKQHTRNWGRIYVASLAIDRSVRIGMLARITWRSGYNGQPAFSPDGRGLYYTWRPGSSQADIWYHDLRTGRERPITCTPEEEYSATVTPDGRAVSVVRVESDSVRRLWRFPFDSAPSPLLRSVNLVAYYVWADEHTIAMFLPAPPDQSGELAFGDVGSGTIARTRIKIGPTLRRVPGRHAISIVEERAPGVSELTIVDLDSHEQQRLVAMPEGADTYAWLSDGTVLVPQGSRILRWSQAEPNWREVANLKNVDPGRITALAVSPTGNRIAIAVHVE